MSPLHVETLRGGLKLTWRKAAWEGLRPLRLAVLALPFLSPGHLSWVAFGLVAVFAYVECVHIFNGTTLWVSPEGLSFKPSPLLWPGQHVLLRREVKALAFRTTPSSRRGYFQIEAILPNQSRQVLFRRVPSAHLAQSIAELIHEHLTRTPAVNEEAETRRA